MLVNPVHPDPIVVPMIRTGCMKHEFDSSYSIRLNGIISQDEYQQSVENINRVARVNVSSIILTLIICLCVITGIALFIAGGLPCRLFFINCAAVTRRANLASQLRVTMAH
ncbi:unnamed protein product [Rotaria socialis]|uniref:Uncharacterized protein n=1 Tax=Rotaria socialis TaxID=392032 RepID=A0A817XBW2_9BILA|nr:unnamed protein product [Rotaria socialis]